MVGVVSSVVPPAGISPIGQSRGDGRLDRAGADEKEGEECRSDNFVFVHIAYVSQGLLLNGAGESKILDGPVLFRPRMREAWAENP